MYEIQTFGATELALHFQALTVEAHILVNAAVRRNAQALLFAIKMHATGRPGPNIITGEYIQSWVLDYHDTPAGLIGNVTTDAPQAMRLEYGFVGADSLGRHYHQPPFPHIAPAEDEVAQTFRWDMEAIAARLARG